jgi:hypothetical protein
MDRAAFTSARGQLAVTTLLTVPAVIFAVLERPLAAGS